MEELLKDKRGNQYRIVKIKVKFSRDIDKKEFVINKFYIIGGGDYALFSEDKRGTSGFEMIPIEQIKRILGN